MKIIIDIGHPAHVHYFKNFIKIMILRGHLLLITARNKELVHFLLSKYNIAFVDRGKGGNTFIGKFFYLFKGDYELLKYAIKFKPDLFISVCSPYAAQISSLLKIHHIALDDTEHAVLGRKMYLPFTNVVLSPQNYRNTYGKKHIFFNGTLDLTYLHKNYFVPDKSILVSNEIGQNESLIFIRFVAWKANHDYWGSKFDLNQKIKLITELSKYGKIIISSELELPSELQKYSLKIQPDKVHSYLFYSDIFIGDSTSMATEAAILGTYSICLNSDATKFGVFDDFLKNNLIEIITDLDEVLNTVKSFLEKPNSKRSLNDNYKEFISNKIDVTSFFIWFIENYPNSFEIMKTNPEYQLKFR